MSLKFGIYKCKVCGNVVQTIINGEGELVCCGEEMELLEPAFKEDEIGEKHVPVIEIRHEGCETGMCKDVKYITLNNHPMEKEHYIQFIEVFDRDKTELRIKLFNPQDKAEYKINNFGSDITAYELCNIHGLWRSVQ